MPDAYQEDVTQFCHGHYDGTCCRKSYALQPEVQEKIMKRDLWRQTLK